MANRSEDSVNCVAKLAGEMIAVHPVLYFQMADDGFNFDHHRISRFIAAAIPRLLPGDVDLGAGSALRTY